MKVYNFYFSPTGGTKKVGDIFSEEWGNHIIQVDLMNKALPSEVLKIGEEDLCIFSLPSYGGRIPVVTVEKLKELEGNCAKAVLIAVFGNRAIDDTLLEMYDILTEAGFRCVAGIEAVAEHSLMRQFGKGRPDKKDREELKAFAAEIKKAEEKGNLRDNPDLPGNRPYREFNGVPLKPVGTAACVKCGICAEECPAGAIPYDHPDKTDKEKCISCMHCASICPVHARKLNAVMKFGAAQKMKKVCTERKDNQLYL